MLIDLLSIDPGVKKCGVAAWSQGTLAYVAWVPWYSILLARDATVKLAVEKPQVYRTTKSKGDPNDIVELALIVGRILGMHGNANRQFLYKPYEWKRQMPKHITEGIIRGMLDEGAVNMVEVCSKAAQEHLWDALGIGLHHQGKYLY